MFCFAKFCRLCLQRSDNLLDFKTKDLDNITLINKIKILMPSLIISNENFPTFICEKCHLQLNNSYDFINNCFKTYQQLIKYSLQLNYYCEKATNLNLTVLLEELVETKYRISGICSNLKDEEDHEKNVNEETKTMFVINAVDPVNKHNKETKNPFVINEENDAEKINKKTETTFVINEEDLVKKRKLDGKYIVKVNEEEGYTVTIKVDGEEDQEENREKIQEENRENQGGNLSEDHLKKLEVVQAEKRENQAETQKDQLEKGKQKHLPQMRCVANEGRVLITEENSTEKPNDDENRIYIVNISNNLIEDDTPEDPTNIPAEKKTPSSTEKKTPSSTEKKTPSSTEKKVHECGTCGKAFVSKPNLKRHYENVHLKIRYNCQICEKQFTQIESLKYHERVVHLNLRRFKCDYCELKCAEPFHLKLHLKRCKKRKEAESNNGGSDLEMNKIKEEKEENNVLEETKMIREIDDDDPPLIIDETTPEEPQPTGSTNPIILDEFDEELPYMCSICKKKFASQAGLKSHYNFIHSKGRHKCDVCKERFVAFKEYRAHKKFAHPIVKRPRCNLCEETFATNALLADHQQNHKMELCTMCVKMFHNVGLLRLHYKHEHKINEDRINQLFLHLQENEKEEQEEEKEEEQEEEKEEERNRPKIEEIMLDDIVFKKEEMDVDETEYLLPD